MNNVPLQNSYYSVPPPPPPPGFWRRQFAQQSTGTQRVFDWLLGVVMPAVCFVADPTIFKSSVAGDALFRELRPFAYVLASIAITAMTIWLIFGAKLRWFAGFLSGLFFAGAAISFVVGIALFPFSVIGLIVVIGALGFTPIFSALIFARNGLRALRTAKPFFERSILIYAVSFGAFCAIFLPGLVHRDIDSTFTNIEAKEAVSPSDERKIRMYALLYDPVRLVRAYQSTDMKSPAADGKRELLRTLYFQRMNRDIDVDHSFAADTIY